MKQTQRIKTGVQYPVSASNKPRSLSTASRHPLGYQRISIACGYCRKRKIRCIQSENEQEKCSNCTRLNRECVVEPIQRPEAQETDSNNGRSKSFSEYGQSNRTGAKAAYAAHIAMQNALSHKNSRGVSPLSRAASFSGSCSPEGNEGNDLTINVSLDKNEFADMPATAPAVLNPSYLHPGYNPQASFFENFQLRQFDRFTDSFNRFNDEITDSKYEQCDQDKFLPDQFSCLAPVCMDVPDLTFSRSPSTSDAYSMDSGYSDQMADWINDRSPLYLSDFNLDYAKEKLSLNENMPEIPASMAEIPCPPRIEITNYPSYPSFQYTFA